MKKSVIAIAFLIVLGFILLSCSSSKKIFPDFKLVSLLGDTITKADFSGKITVINIWASWCKPCIGEIPLLNKVVEKYKDDKSVQFISLTDDDIEKAKNVVDRTSFNYKHIANAKKLIDQLSGMIQVRPKHIILNQQCEIVEEKSGATDDIDQYLIKQIEGLLKKK